MSHKKVGLGLAVLALSAVLGATVLREPIASAASPFQNVIIGNTPSQPVPVREQGTVNVNVSGGTVALASPPLATRRVGGIVGSCTPGPCSGALTFARMTASTIVLMAEGSRATFTFRDGGSGGPIVYSVAVAANTTTAIPLDDRLVTDYVADFCPNACSTSVSLLGQNAP